MLDTVMLPGRRTWTTPGISMKVLVLLALFSAGLEAAAQDTTNTTDPDLDEELTEADFDFDTYCKPTADRGTCTGHFPSWWFNVIMGRCEQFVYTGCEGNDNNYATKEECELTCLMRGDGSQTSDPGQTQEDAEALLDCFVEPDKGPCEESIFRYYFDPESGTCQLFFYGGCEGNRNNYNTEKECMAKCNPSNEYHSKCLIKADRGNLCRASVPMWAYNGTTGQCEKFTWSGCLGNDNRYLTKEDCEMTCKRQPGIVNPICFEPKYPGPCSANLTQYYYNRWSRTCEEFLYGGCRGNGNYFATLEECQNTCWEQ